jgi:hypothetical protein
MNSHNLKPSLYSSSKSFVETSHVYVLLALSHNLCDKFILFFDSSELISHAHSEFSSFISHFAIW